MKARVYIRVAKMRSGKAKVAASTRPTHNALRDALSDLPTVGFAVEFVIPDSMFRRDEQVVATVTIPEEAVDIVATVEERTNEEAAE